MAWLPGWKYRRKILANTSALVATETNIQLALFAPDLTAKVQADFDDAVVTNADGVSLLKYGWEAKIAAAGVGHFKVPALTHGQASLLVGYLHCGNPAATDQSDLANTYDANHMAAWLLNEASGTLVDSTGRLHTGTTSGSPTYGVPGKIDGGMDFERTSEQYFTALDHADFTLSAAFTLECWVKLESVGDYHYLLNQWGDIGAGLAAWEVQIRATNYVRMSCCDGVGSSSLEDDTTPLSAGIWYHIVCVYLGGTTGTNALIYINGTLVKSGTINRVPQDSGYPMTFGRRASDPGAYFFDGVGDELAISNIGRSASYAKARAMAGAGTLLSFGDWEISGHQSHDALDLPIYGARYNMPLSWVDADGAPTTPTALDIEISKDNGDFANATHVAILAHEVGGATESPFGYLTLTETEMSAELIHGQAKDATAKAARFLVRPKHLPVLRDSQATGGGNSTITLDAGASTINDEYNGLYVLIDADTGSGQARKIIDYVGSTKVATIAGSWETNPDATSDYQLLVPDGWAQAAAARALLAIPNIAHSAANGLPTVGTGTGQVNVTGGRADADLKYLFGTTLTEAAGAGKLAAALSKFLDVATPLLVASDAQRGTDGAALASLWTSTIAGRIDEAVSAAKTLTSAYNAAKTAAQAGDAMALSDGAITAAKVADGAIDDAALAADMDTYQARVELIDDDNGTTDRYIVAWFKNSQPVTSGITVPTIQVVKCADATDLVAEAALTQVGSLGLYHKAETTNRAVSGVAYIAKITATIEAATRTWYEPIGRDT